MPAHLRSVDQLELAALVRPGDTVFWPQGTGEPVTLTEALVAQRAEIGPVRVLLGLSLTETLRPEHADHIRFTATGGFGANRRLAAAGLLDIIPCHASDVPRLIDSGTLPVDVVLLSVSPADASGTYSMGVVADHVRAAIRHARVVIAEVSERIPRTCGDTLIDADEIDVAVHSSREALEFPEPRIGQIERAVARHIADRVPDGATLQFGIGAICHAACEAMRGKRDLGIHSGLISDPVADLIDAGVITNRRKGVDRGASVTAVLFGTRRLYAHAHENPRIRLHPVSYTHDPVVIARLGCFYSINSALEVDLTGQVNAEVLGGAHVGTVGGAVDFVRAAAASPDGRSVIGLPATARSGASRIVARVSSGVTSTPRSDVDLVATEFGVAELRGRSLSERASSLIAIADPRFRDELSVAARALC